MRWNAIIYKKFENGVSKGLNFIPGIKIINQLKKYKLQL